MTETRRLLVRDMTVEAQDVLRLGLVDEASVKLPEWEPGAHLTLELANGLTRQYSLCGDPADRNRYEVAILHDKHGRGGSKFVHTTLRPGDHVTAHGPKNHFQFERAARYVFVAGGIGITPILPMVELADRLGAEFTVLYGGRNQQSMSFQSRLARFGDRVQLFFDDVHGLIDLEHALAYPCPDTLLYCCGPESLISAVIAGSTTWNPNAIRFERFSAQLPTQFQNDTEAVGFEVELGSSGTSLIVPADRSVLDVLLEAGVDIPYDCTEGICGSCEVRVTEGEVDHRDIVLTAAERAENQLMMVCCSRARSRRLVLDL